jgi:hypothetical protein
VSTQRLSLGLEITANVCVCPLLSSEGNRSAPFLASLTVLPGLPLQGEGCPPPFPPDRLYSGIIHSRTLEASSFVSTQLTSLPSLSPVSLEPSRLVLWTDFPDHQGHALPLEPSPTEAVWGLSPVSFHPALFSCQVRKAEVMGMRRDWRVKTRMAGRETL